MLSVSNCFTAYHNLFIHSIGLILTWGSWIKTIFLCNGPAGSQNCFKFNFITNWHTCFQSGCIILHSLQQCIDSSNCSTYVTTFIIVSLFLFLAILMWFFQPSHVSLIVLSLMSNYANHIFLCFLVISLSSFVKWMFSSLANFLNLSFCYWFTQIVYVLDTFVLNYESSIHPLVFHDKCFLLFSLKLFACPKFTKIFPSVFFWKLYSFSYYIQDYYLSWANVCKCCELGVKFHFLFHTETCLFQDNLLQRVSFRHWTALAMFFWKSVHLYVYGSLSRLTILCQFSIFT